jgi:conjugative transposon TraN protein
MKQMWAVWLFFLCLSAHSQTAIPSYSLSVTYQMTTNIIFPYRIEKADIGSGDVIGHKAEKLENVLLLKANRKNFIPTNLSVYTTDGKFYSFIVRYSAYPDTLNLCFSNNMIRSQNEAVLDTDANLIDHQPVFLHKSATTEGMKAVLKGIFIKEQLMWFKIEIENSSPIDYEPDFIKFYIKDRRVPKRTAVQETELPPTWRTTNKLIPGQGKISFIFGIPAFTIDRQKKLLIQISEKNGGRELTILVKAKTLLKSRNTLP